MIHVVMDGSASCPKPHIYGLYYHKTTQIVTFVRLEETANKKSRIKSQSRPLLAGKTFF